MKTSIKIAVAALVIASFGFEGCKKGPNDPAFSFSSRKARMAGDWKYASGEGKSYDGINTHTVWTYDGSTLSSTATTTTPASTNTSLTSVTMSVTFEKEGAYKQVTTTTTPSPNASTRTLTETGTWNFTGSVGTNNNNKDHIVMVLLSSTEVYTANSVTTTTAYSYTGDDAPVSLYFLDKLSSKEIVMTYEGTSTSGGVTSTNEGSWTLKP
ncbi:hypothetical protein BH11BAC7_BH11BAC7_31730 [soil metagenome]